MTPYRTCRDCGQQMSSKRQRLPGTVAFGAEGRCTVCYRRVLRARTTPASTRRNRPLTGHGSKAERIEQAIARGLTATAISETLGATADEVHAVWDLLDKITDEVDDPNSRDETTAA